MIDKINSLGAKNLFTILIIAVFITDITIFLNAPYIRQILGFLFLTLLPGLLILQILRLNKLGATEKFVLSVGLSISFVMFFGLLLNNTLFSLGYETPLATFPLLISFNIAFLALAIIGLRTNKDPIFSLPRLNLTTPEKAFLIVPILFPALSILGMYIMNITDNNIILMLLLILIPAYVALVCFFNQKFPKRLYPVVIFSISISLLLLMALRSNHIVIGSDTGREFYFFQVTLNNLHWSVSGHSALDACLGSSLLPAIYQSVLNINPEFLFKILYALICSISPLVVYVLSKKYIGESYAFLASCFFIFQDNFLLVASNTRVNLAVLFFALAMMTLFNDNIDPLKKRVLFIVFMASCVVSHYATAYIFFIIMLGAFVGMEMLSKKYTFKNVINLTMVLLFFAFIFFWYSQVTETAFSAGVGFIEKTLGNLNTFFVEESRRGTRELFGGEIMRRGIPYALEFVSTWLTFVFIGIGIITLIRRYKEMSFPEPNFKKPDFLKDKFEVTYSLIALACAGLVVVMIMIPYVSRGYDMFRLYTLVTTILSVFFVIGGIIISKHFFFKTFFKTFIKNLSLKKKTCAKRKSVDQTASQGRTYLIILLVLIPYFFSATGVTYQVFGIPHSIILNSHGEAYNKGAIIHDQDSSASKWLANYMDQKEIIHSTVYAWDVLPSQGLILPSRINRHIIINCVIRRPLDGYIYLRYRNIADRKTPVQYPDGRVEYHSIEEFPDMFAKKNKIYTSEFSEVWK